MRVHGNLTYPKLVLLESQLGEHYLLGKQQLVEEYIQDLEWMSPLMAHIRMCVILGRRATKFAKEFYEWHCKKLGVEPKRYNKDQYKILLGRKRVKALIETHWGKQMPKQYTITCKVEIEGETQLIQILSDKQLTDGEIQKMLPKRIKFIQVLRVKDE